MPYNRSIDTNGVLITHLTGTVTFDELINMAVEMPEYIRDGKLYEVVVHADDVELFLSREESQMSTDRLQRILNRVDKAAIAFVAADHFVFGLCRQLQLQIENSRIQVAVFREQSRAGDWVMEMKGAN